MNIRQVTTPALAPVTLGEAKLFLRVDHADEDDLISALVAAATAKLEERTRRAFIARDIVGFAAAIPTDGVELPRPPLSRVASVRYWADLGQAKSGSDGVLTVNSAGSHSFLAPTAAVGAPDDLHLFAHDGSFGPVTLDLDGLTLSETVPNGTYAVDWGVGADPWAEFAGWNIDPFDFPARLYLNVAADPPDFGEDRPGGRWRVAYEAGYGDRTTDIPEPIRNAVKLLVGYLYEHRGDDPRAVPIPPGIGFLVEEFIVPHAI